jgi:UDP-glucose 4-epimerase
MKVLITGAGGNLGRSLAPLLKASGHTPRLFDFRPIETEYEFIQGDVRNPEQVEAAVKGIDMIVHGAALHGIHTNKWAPQDFWQINDTGTFNVFEAARQEAIKHLVLCSTMGVYGESMEPPAGEWGIVTEDSPVLPRDIYGMSKLLCEEMGRYYSRRWGISTVALRLGMFVPETFERYGFRLLFGGVDDRDVAQAALLALTYQPAGGFDFFNIFAEVPFGPQDAGPLYREPATVLEKYWPGCTELFKEKGLNLSELLWGKLIWPVGKARQELGYRPGYNFSGFLQALKEGNHSYYPFANLPRWGV